MRSRISRSPRRRASSSTRRDSSSASGALWSTAVRHITRRLRDLSSIVSLSSSGRWGKSASTSRSWPAASRKRAFCRAVYAAFFQSGTASVALPAAPRWYAAISGWASARPDATSISPDGAMHSDPVGSEHGAVRRFVEEGVAEAHLIRFRPGLDDGMVLQPPELGVDDGSFEPGCGQEQRAIERPSDDGGGLRHALRLTDTVEAGGDDFLERRRHRRLGELRTVRQRARQLFEEQGYAVGSLHQCVADLGLQLCDGGQHLEQLRALRHDPTCPASGARRAARAGRRRSQAGRS